MKYIDTEKLIAEINELKEMYLVYQDKFIFDDKDLSIFYEGKSKMCDEILSLLSSLQQEQSIQISTLTWKDINDLEEIINSVHNEFCNGIGAKSFGEEVLERFKEERDEQEQPESICSCYWKPSEIDMKYLDLAIVLAEADKSYNLADALKRLRDELKKL